MERRKIGRTDGIVEGYRQFDFVVRRAVNRAVRGNAPSERHRLSERDRFHSWYYARVFENPTIIIDPLRAGVVVSGRERDDHAQRVLDLNAGMYARDRGETFPDETRANEKHHRERDLDDDERAAVPH